MLGTRAGEVLRRVRVAARVHGFNLEGFGRARPDEWDAFVAAEVHHCLKFFDGLPRVRYPDVSTEMVRVMVEKWCGHDIRHGAVMAAAAVAGIPLKRRSDCILSGQVGLSRRGLRIRAVQIYERTGERVNI